MSIVETEPPETETEAERIARWRLEQLVHAGFEETAAVRLAAEPHVDLHLASNLLRRGCPADTALRILL
ncbi:MAG: hypothetical protein MSC30_00135 [Gaiellaceae bacterium MAG52_C11]|nr:hypothetical protein [Candidatus Gaiellasilicea maunaloa]